MSQLDDSNQLKSFNQLCIHIYKKIVKEIDSRDLVSLIELSDIYQAEHRFADALSCLNTLMEITPAQRKIESCNHIIRLLDAEYKYNKKYNYLTKDELSGQKVIDKCNEFMMLYPRRSKIVCPYARFLKDLKRFKDAEKTLQTLPDNFLQKHKELGMLYSSRPINDKIMNMNPVYNLEKAIDEYEKALSIMDNKTNNKTKKSIYIPLAMAYLQNNDFANSRRICEEVKKFDIRDKKITRLLQQIDDQEKENLLLLSYFESDTRNVVEDEDEHHHLTREQFREKLRRNSTLY
jgi:tetratricopeptide (TPR) repeat protein